MDFSFKSLKNELIAPGDIFWQKKSGDSVLISKKGDVLNISLIKKIDEAGHALLIENCVNLEFYQEFEGLYKKYSEELLMRDKIKCREEMIKLLRVEFIEKEKEQFEFNILAWKLFSKFTHEDGLRFIGRDSELFKRHLSVASSYAVCAFLLGYYETNFLSRIFSSTLEHLMELGKSASVLSLKETLEYLRMQESFNEEDWAVVKEIASSELLQKTVVFEKYDGSGPRNINSREMSDLEIVLVALNAAYSFMEGASGNILAKIKNGDLRCEKRTMKLLQRILTKEEEDLQMAAA